MYNYTYILVNCNIQGMYNIIRNSPIGMSWENVVYEQPFLQLWVAHEHPWSFNSGDYIRTAIMVDEDMHTDSPSPVIGRGAIAELTLVNSLKSQEPRYSIPPNPGRSHHADKYTRKKITMIFHKFPLDRVMKTMVRAHLCVCVLD